MVTPAPAPYYHFFNESLLLRGGHVGGNPVVLALGIWTRNSLFRARGLVSLTLASFAVLVSCGGSGGAPAGGTVPPPPVTHALTVTMSGTGSVTSSPAGINCSATCTANFSAGTTVTLTEQFGTGNIFQGWGGGCTGTSPTCVLTMNGAMSVSAAFVAGGGSASLTVTGAGTGTGTVTSSPAGISCGATCTSSFPALASVTLTAAPASGSRFVSWSGACTGTALTCTLVPGTSTAVSATFSLVAGSACAQGTSSIAWTVPPSSNDFNYANSNSITKGSFGNYIVAIDDWTSTPLAMWINDQACWGATTTIRKDPLSPGMAPNVTRGWIYNQTAMNLLSDAGTQNWTTKSGMGIQLSALTKARVHWSMSAPTVPYPASRWDALLDIFFHTMQHPLQDGTGWYPEVDLQIIPAMMDSGYYKAVATGNGAQLVTLGGVGYVAIVDAMGPFNQTGGHTITMFARPTDFSEAGTGFLWGNLSQTHDLFAIITFWMQANPKDDGGTPIHFGSAGWSALKGQAVTTPLLNAAWYLTAVNGDFEINFGDGTTPWITNDFWVAVQNEPDGL
jgi:hypothetical protein